jgi:diaminobutyrate-2-oxoglutarate transaminase
MALVLLKPALDRWQPGQHNGTFRGNNHAFVTATAAIDHYWRGDSFRGEIEQKSAMLGRALKKLSDHAGLALLRPKGRGMIQGLQCNSGAIARQISERAFARKLIIETSGSDGQVVKCLCPLTITDAEMQEGLARLSESVYEVLNDKLRKVS